MIEVRGTGVLVDASAEVGYVYVFSDNTTFQFTVPQSTQLRALLERAEQVVSSGIGDMKDRG